MTLYTIKLYHKELGSIENVMNSNDEASIMKRLFELEKEYPTDEIWVVNNFQEILVG